jgi:hypothetical protein
MTNPQCPTGTHEAGSNALCPTCIYNNLTIDNQVLAMIANTDYRETIAMERAKETVS